MIWIVKKFLEVFTKKNCKKLVNKFRIEKVLKRKGDNCNTSNGKGMIIVLIAGLIKKTLNEIFKLIFLHETFWIKFFKWNFLNEIFQIKVSKWNFLNEIF